VLRSPFKHKASQESFEQRIHRRFITIEGDKGDVNRFVRFAMAFSSPTVGIHYRTRSIEPIENYYRMNLPPDHPLRREARGEFATTQAATSNDTVVMKVNE
jgi:hypothetical protein